MTMAPRYPAYKASGVEWLGEIPAHWDLRRMKFVCTINPSKSETAYLPKDMEVSFLPMELVGLGSLDLTQTRSIGSVRQGFTYFRDGDVLVAKITPSFENGKGAVASGLVNGIGFGTTELHVIRPSAEIERTFLYFLTQSHQFRGMGETQMQGTAGQKRVPDAFINDFPTPVPPVKEQRAIVAYLNSETTRIDALLAAKHQLLEKLARQRLAIIFHAVTKGLGPDVKMKDSRVEWLRMVPEHWSVWKVAHIFRQIGSGTTPPVNKNENYYNGDVPWVNTSDLRDALIKSTQKSVTRKAITEFPALRIYPSDTVLVAMYGATIGKVGLLKISATTNQACCALSQPRNLHPKFAYYSLIACRQWLVGLAYGGGQPNISQGTIRNLRLPVPPILEQRNIIDYLDRETARIDLLIKRIEESIDLLQRQRTALVSAAVAGQIRV